MSWTHLVPCLLGSEVIHVQDISGRRGRALVKYSYPKRDGAEHDDMGAEAGEWSLGVVFFGATYEADYMRLVALMNAALPVTFTHPHHGTTTVRIESIRDRTSTEGAQYIEADVSVVEDVVDVVGFTPTTSVASAANAFDDAASSASSSIGGL